MRPRRYLIDDIFMVMVISNKVNPNQVTFKQVRKPRCNRKRYLVVILNGGEAVEDQSEKIDPMQYQFFCQG